MCTGFEVGLLALGAISAGTAIHGGIQQERAQQRGLAMQRTAQQQAEDVATRQRRDAARAAAALARKQKQFELSEIMAAEEELSRLGGKATTLTGGTTTLTGKPQSTFSGY